MYQEGIAIPDQAGKKEAYLGLIQTFKEDDAVFSVEEAKLLEKLIANNKEALQQQPENYTEVCFEVGKLFWYYYDYGDGTDNQVTKAKSSIAWFQDVLDYAPEGYKNMAMARVYANIGQFYRDITTNITEASDKGQYRPLLDNLSELMDTVAEDGTESEIVRLELLELTRSAIQQYATKFKLDGVTQKELEQMIQQVEAVVESIQTTTDKTQEMQQSIVRLLPDTSSAVEAAYGTNRGGETS